MPTIMSTTEIKHRAIHDVEQETRGFPALILLSCARLAVTSARTLEDNGLLRDALRQYVKASSLLKLVMDSREYNVERPRVLQAAFNEFLSDNNDLISRVAHISRVIEEADVAADKGLLWLPTTHAGLSGGCDFREPVVVSTLSAIRELSNTQSTNKQHCGNGAKPFPCFSDLPSFTPPAVQWAAASAHGLNATTQLRHVLRRTQTS